MRIKTINGNFFTICTRRLNASATNNCSVSAPGNGFDGAIQKGPSPWAPLSDFKNRPGRPKMFGASPETFYNSLSLFARSNEASFYGNASGWAGQGRFEKGSAPLAPLGGFKNWPGGSKICGTAPEPFYNSLFALVLTALRFMEMTWGAEQCRECLKWRNLPKRTRNKRI